MSETAALTKLRVAVVSQWYPPEPVYQPQWIVRALERRGATCEVLTGAPNYPNGQVHEGYQAWRRSRETIEGVPVHRTPLYPDHGSGAVKRLLNYASWAASSAVVGLGPLARADVVLVYSSPATAALPAMVNRARHGVPYVLLIQDVWPDSILDSGFLPGWLGKLARSSIDVFVRWSYRRAAGVIVTSPGMRDLLVERGVPAAKISLIYNWIERHPSASGRSAGLRTRLGFGADDFVVMYAGNHGGAQALGRVVRAFGEIAASERCHLVLVGDGIEKESLVRQAHHLASERVHFVDPQPRASIEALMVEADAQLVSLADRPLFRVTMPSKVQAALAAGQPVLAHASGDVAQIVLEAEAGLATPAGDHGALVAAIRDMRVAPKEKRHEWGENASAYYEAHMAEPVGARRMMDVLCRVAQSRRPRPADTR